MEKKTKKNLGAAWNGNRKWSDGEFRVVFCMKKAEKKKRRRRSDLPGLDEIKNKT